jgi:hypothetical protein
MFSLDFCQFRVIYILTSFIKFDYAGIIPV